MKNSFVIAIALLVGSVANAQTETPARPGVPDTSTASVETLIDTSIGKAYVSRPERLASLTTETLTSSHIFPALGTYKATGASSAAVTITLDETNKGMVWIEGLPQGRFKAIMKKAPSTYKIPAQKSETGKTIQEGTLYVNTENDELTIVLGSSFNDANPTSFLNTSSKKKSGWRYTGIKADAEAPVNSSVPQQ
ncbi:MAG TPA: hypothetical protein VEX65_02285 [Flavisolibacter sp.]|nr:hypothetical protein [Flavisolibacter sp.]